MEEGQGWMRVRVETGGGSGVEEGKGWILEGNSMG